MSHSLNHINLWNCFDMSACSMPHKMDMICFPMPRVMQVAESPGFSSAFEADEATMWSPMMSFVVVKTDAY